MKKKTEYYISLLIFIGAPILIGAGILMAVLGDNVGNENLAVCGLLMMSFALWWLLIWLIRVLGMRFVTKEQRKIDSKLRAEQKEREKIMADAFEEFQAKTDYPETNTLKLVDAGMEFFAEGRYVLEKDFKGVKGDHLAFEICSKDLKHKPEDYDDVCDYESNGVLIAAGYLDGDAFEKYTTKNGVILPESPENSLGKTITLKEGSGYNFSVWTAECDDIDYGFAKIIKCEGDVLTVYFKMFVLCGLNDIIEGTVELRKDTDQGSHDIQALITKIKRKHYNTIDVSAEEIQSIKEANPFLPESYITFLKEVGFADLDWIDLGWNNKTPTNLDADETEDMKELFKKHADKNLAVDDFYFIAIDNDGGYYAFCKNPEDHKAYAFSDDKTFGISYETFEDLLYEILTA